jgi:hypothetical protein
MTTQAEVAAAFINRDDGPRSASNFKYREEGVEALITGGRNGNEVVLAERGPLGDITVYCGYPDWSSHSFHQSDIRNQAWVIRGSLRRSEMDESLYELLRTSSPPALEDHERYNDWDTNGR